MIDRRWCGQKEIAKELCQQYPTVFIDKTLETRLTPTRYIRTQLDKPELWFVDTRNDPKYHWAQVIENGVRIWFLMGGCDQHYISNFFDNPRVWKTFHGQQTISERQWMAKQQRQEPTYSKVMVYPFRINWVRMRSKTYKWRPNKHGTWRETRVETVSCLEEQFRMQPEDIDKWEWSQLFFSG